ncbi:hypothetical protein [Burkholderia sp. WP9]|uniref:hypothetical protein n=1 Tax=Burkholderia sp. WP9 TaxID=1500263 RepID=UPI000B80A7A9|nr:hypothetical protein [Burkholderia sp. WP9]
MEVKLAAMEATARTVLAVSSSTYGIFGLHKAAPLERFDLVITDDGLPPDAALGMRKARVELELATVS